MATWPSSLPQSPLLEGFSDTAVDTVLRSDFDGYTKIRNRFSAVIHNVNEQYILTPNEYSIFRTFFFDTLSNGSIDFTKPDPVEGGTSVYRFLEPYKAEFLGTVWRISIRLEKLP